MSPFGSPPPARLSGAQDTDSDTALIEIREPGRITVQAALCTDPTCATFAELLDDFAISAIDPKTGEVYSSCATGNTQQALPHQCILDVPHGGAFELTWSEDQVPAGHVSFGEPIITGTPA